MTIVIDGKEEMHEKEGKMVNLGTLMNLNSLSTNIDLIVDPDLFSNNQCNVTFGRSSSCDVVLKGVDISSIHCILTVQVGNEGLIFELNDSSLNGTWVNGSKIKKTSANLKTNDVIMFGVAHEYLLKLNPRFTANSPIKMGNIKSIFECYNFSEQDLIGSGSFGSVFRAVDRYTNKLVAIKIIQSSKTSSILKEISSLKSCTHENIIEIVDQFTFERPGHLPLTCLVLEYVESGDLYNKVTSNENGCLNELETKFYFEQILAGVHYLHSNGIIHRDLKLENILLHRSATPYLSKLSGKRSTQLYGDIIIKIADFGLSKCLGDELFTKTICGTPQYVAPEILQHTGSNAKPYTKQVDLWSCGVVLFACLFGHFPFDMDDQIRDSISYKASSAFILKTLSHECIELYQGLLNVDPFDRFDCHSAYYNDWFLQDFSYPQEKIFMDGPSNCKKIPSVVNKHLKNQLDMVYPNNEQFQNLLIPPGSPPSYPIPKPSIMSLSSQPSSYYPKKLSDKQSLLQPKNTLGISFFDSLKLEEENCF